MFNNRALSWGLAGLVLLFSACAQLSQPVVTDGGYAVVPIYFATTRNDSGHDNLNTRFGSERSATNYGLNQVAIPDDFPRAHSASFIHWNMVLRRNPEDHVALLNTQRKTKDEFFTHLRDALVTPEEPLLVFIHGFNTPFERATRISAKLSYDLNLTNPALLFAWPTHDRPSTYPADADNLSWSQPYVTEFYRDLMTQLPQQTFIFLGHSMGTRAMGRGLIDLLEDMPYSRERIKAIAFAAPDIDAAIFRRDMAPALIQHQIPITLYTSRRDLAIYASNQLHKYPRAGYAGENIVVIPGIDTVDASHGESELIGHEYFYQGSHTIRDLYQWLIEGKPASKRAQLVPIFHEDGRYWQIQPEFSSTD